MNKLCGVICLCFSLWVFIHTNGEFAQITNSYLFYFISLVMFIIAIRFIFKDESNDQAKD
ncbi:hypothetical protein [Clostridium baratii]|uniref:hypothetical protein n=1 Tax=Clostridium baratii TaxID=1561 RepID=UPI00291441A0|nr:hypothetical protein [Clostridium baratii]MDU4912716.1 hypothetical protein [Clostridium baratii]